MRARGRGCNADERAPQVSVSKGMGHTAEEGKVMGPNEMKVWENWLREMGREAMVSAQHMPSFSFPFSNFCFLFSFPISILSSNFKYGFEVQFKFNAQPKIFSMKCKV